MATKAQKATTQSESPQQQTLPMMFASILSVSTATVGLTPR